MSWIKRKTSYVTDPETGEPVATSRTITWPGGRVETVPARDLIGLTPEKRAQGAETGVYRLSGNIFLRTAAEMRAKATSLAVELGLRKRASASQTTTAAEMRAKSRTLASELGMRTKPDECDCPCIPCSAQSDCENCDCGAGCDGESCDSESCQCADHRSAIRPAEGRTIHPTPFIGDIIEEKRIDTAVYESRLKLKLAAASR
jgi:hypothetical protein